MSVHKFQSDKSIHTKKLIEKQLQSFRQKEIDFNAQFDDIEFKLLLIKRLTEAVEEKLIQFFGLKMEDRKSVV